MTLVNKHDELRYKIHSLKSYMPALEEQFTYRTRLFPLTQLNSNGHKQYTARLFEQSTRFYDFRNITILSSMNSVIHNQRQNICRQIARLFSTLPLTKRPCYSFSMSYITFLQLYLVFGSILAEIINTILVLSLDIVKMASTASVQVTLIHFIFFRWISDISKISSHAPNLSNSLIRKFCLSLHGITMLGSKKDCATVYYCLLLSPGLSNQQCSSRY